MTPLHLSKRGAFLTLGITFVSILVLTLASLILRNAETSEERISELGSFERFYITDESIRETYYSMLRDIMNITLNVTVDTLTNQSSARFRHAMPHSKHIDLHLQSFNDARTLLFLLYGGLLTKDFGFNFIIDQLRFNIRPYNVYYDYYFAEGSGSGGLGANYSNNTHVVFITRMNTSDQSNPLSLTFLLKYNESLPGYNGSLNWVTNNIDACCNVNLTFILEGPNNYRIIDSRMAYLKSIGGKTSQRVEIGNLTGGGTPVFLAGTFNQMGALIFVNSDNNFDLADVTLLFNATNAPEKLKIYSRDEMNVSFVEYGISKYGPILLA